MRFEVLGPVRIRRDDDVVTVSGALRRRLLAMLLAHRNQSVPVDTLLAALWGEQTDSRGTQRLHLHVHKLRILLGEPSRISYSPGGYSIKVLPGELDIDEFDALLDEATCLAANDPQRRADLLRKALSLFHGTPYDGADLVELNGEIQSCTERRLTALEELYAAEIRCGRHTAIVAELTELVSHHPLRERLQVLLMTALAQGGRQAEALAAYRTARAVLVEELGLEPGPELQQIQQQVLSGDDVRHRTR